MSKTIPLQPLFLSEFYYIEGECYQSLLFSYYKVSDNKFEEIIYLSIDEAIKDKNRTEKIYFHVWYSDDDKQEFYLINDKTKMDL